ncbi:MAG: hypothetical protein IJC17_05220 [Clostridia bacterium]|nr:hypothetical protein [Clostridia bacterium]
MSTLKEDWEIVGKELGATLEDMGKAILKTAKIGAAKLDKWIGDELNNHEKR